MVSDKSVLITGIARNVARVIPKEIERIEKEFEKIFRSISFLVIESDSTDNTLELLKKIKQNKQNFNYISLGKVEHTLPDRIERLAFCRNSYVKEIRNNDIYNNVDFVAVVDFDIKNNRLNLRELDVMINNFNNEWKAIFANQTGLYFDIYALRKDGWVENDCFTEYEALSKSMKRQEAKEIAIWSKMKRIKKDSPLITVDSAFGGLGIYRRNVFIYFDYTLIPGRRHESEHVSLHKKIRDSNGLLLIVPKMTNFAWGTHNLSRFKFIRVLDQASNRKGFRKIRDLARKLLS